MAARSALSTFGEQPGSDVRGGDEGVAGKKGAPGLDAADRGVVDEVVGGLLAARGVVGDGANEEEDVVVVGGEGLGVEGGRRPRKRPPPPRRCRRVACGGAAAG